MLILNFKFLIFLSVLIGFIPIQSYAQKPVVAPAPVESEAAQIKKDRLSITKANGEQISFNVELALTPAQQAKGLMFRTEMPDDEGMLFVFEGEANRSFWMKNTLIPLDMIFVRRNGIIHHIHSNAIPQDLTAVKSNGPVYAVLEINGGLSKKLGLKPGDKLNHAAFGLMNIK